MINFEAFGNQVLLDSGQDSITKSGILLTTEKIRDLEINRPYKIVNYGSSISEELKGVIDYKRKKDEDVYVYMNDIATPMPLEFNDHYYILLRDTDIAGIAPNGFNEKEWKKMKEEKAKRANPKSSKLHVAHDKLGKGGTF